MTPRPQVEVNKDSQIPMQTLTGLWDRDDVYGSYANNTMEAILKKTALTPQQEPQKIMSQTPKPDTMRKLQVNEPRQSERSSKQGMYNTNISRRDSRKMPPRRENRSVVSGTNRSDLSNMVAVGSDKKK